MKTSLAKAIALAATLGAAASAQAAITVNPNGVGQVLLYPMYTVENGNDTAISVTNTTDEFKVVKVRFREALNSQDVLDFHLFLSPKDVWNGVVVATEAGAKLVTRDTSCTVPAIPADGQPFTDLAYTGKAVETAKRGQDGGPQDLKRTRVGYAEIIELGVLDGGLPTSTDKPGAAAGTKITFAEAIKHVNGVPGNCGAIVNEYLTGKWKDGTATAKGVTPGATADSTGFYYGFKAPGLTNVGGGTAAVYGGLYGVGTITNVFAGQQIGYDATAIDGFIDVAAAAPGNLHNATGYSFPDLNGNRAPATDVSVPKPGIGAVTTAQRPGGAVATFRKAIDAVSYVLQRPSLSNEFSVDSAVGAGTDWVVTFPTKHHYIWESQIQANGARTVNAAGEPSGAAPALTGAAVADFSAADGSTARTVAQNVAPFAVTSLWKGANGNAKAPVPVDLSYVDREEREVVAGISFSPRPATGGQNLDYEANVVTFNNSNVLVAQDSYARYNVSNLEFASGWATIGLGGGDLLTGADGIGAASGATGLPAIGFATIKVANGNLNGVLSNYNSAWNHKSN